MATVTKCHSTLTSFHGPLLVAGYGVIGFSDGPVISVMRVTQHRIFTDGDRYFLDQALYAIGFTRV